MELKAIPVTALPLTDLKVPKPLNAAQPSGKEQAAVKKVAREFESMFVSMMLKSMRATVGEDKLTGGGHGEEAYRSLLDEQYAARAAESGTLGLAVMLERQLTPAASAPAKEQDHAD